MHFDFDTWATEMCGERPDLSFDEAAEEAAWNWLARESWVPVPELFFAMKEVIREQMLGG